MEYHQPGGYRGVQLHDLIKKQPPPSVAATYRRQAKTEAKRLLSTMFAVPGWRCSLDLDSEEALSLTSVLLKEEAEALSQAADGETRTKVLTPPCPCYPVLMVFVYTTAKQTRPRSFLFPNTRTPAPPPSTWTPWIDAPDTGGLFPATFARFCGVVLLWHLVEDAD